MKRAAMIALALILSFGAGRAGFIPANAGGSSIPEPDPRVMESVVRIFIDDQPAASGTCIAPQVILTARHVVERERGELENNLSVEFRMDKHRASVRVAADILAYDKNHDIALLSVDFNAPRTAKLCKDPNIRNGTAVWVMGFPMGTPGVSCTLGWLTNTGGGHSGEPSAWQCTANAFFGNSGGAVVDAQSGEVIGVLVAGKGTGWQMAPNIALFVPVEHVHALLKHVKR